MTNGLENLLEEITSQPALENDFYRKWMSESFSIEELEVFARNYGAWVKSFPDAMATLVLGTDDIDAKNEYVKTLYSEMGYGNWLETLAPRFKERNEQLRVALQHRPLCCEHHQTSSRSFSKLTTRDRR